MRAFIGIELNQSVKEALAEVQDELKCRDEDIKWVNPQNMHLTLKFLGEVNEGRIPKITQLLKDIAHNQRQFIMEIKDIGSFPNLKSPRVVWAGIEKGKEELKELTAAIENALVSLKFPKESRTFSAHLTIGRVKHIKDKRAFEQKLTRLTFPSRTQEAKSIILFKSTLTPKGPIYEKIAEENLKDSNSSSK